MDSPTFSACGDMRNEDGAHADTVRSDRRNIDRLGGMCCRCWKLGHKASGRWSRLNAHGNGAIEASRLGDDGCI